MDDKQNIGELWVESLQGQNYAAEMNLDDVKKFIQSPYIQIIDQYAKLSAGSLVLEPGTGSGKFSFSFAQLGHRVVVFDFIDAILREVWQREQALSPQLNDPIGAYHQGDLEQLPYGDDTFDLVVNEGVVEHWLDVEGRQHVFREMMRVTKPGGTVAILVPNGHHPKIDQWDETFFKNAPAMTYFDHHRLAREMRMVGLENVQFDGVYPWRSWIRSGKPHWAYLFAAGLDKYLPLPREWRGRWAINLIAVSRKPFVH